MTPFRKGDRVIVTRDLNLAHPWSIGRGATGTIDSIIEGQDGMVLVVFDNNPEPVFVLTKKIRKLNGLDAILELIGR